MLFGVPERETLEAAFGRDNPVWKAVGALLGWVSWRYRCGGEREGGGLFTAHGHGRDGFNWFGNPMRGWVVFDFFFVCVQHRVGLL